MTDTKPINRDVDDLLARIARDSATSALNDADAVIHSLIGDDTTEHIQQAGVLGMKWGVRNAESRARARREGGTDDPVRKKASKRPRQNGSLSSNPQNKQMTSAEMKKIVDRLRLEREFSQLTAREMVPESRIKRMMKDVAFDVVKGASTEVGKAILSQALKTEFNKRASDPYKIKVK